MSLTSESIAFISQEEQTSAFFELTNSEPKTGTTVFAWFMSVLFQRVCKRMMKTTTKACAANVTNKYEYTLQTLGRSINFVGFRKHHLFACGEGILTRHEIEDAADNCVDRNIPGWSSKCLVLNQISIPEKSKQCKGRDDAVMLVTYRDPIAASLSWVYYKGGYSLARNEVNSRVKALCGKIAARIGLRLYLSWFDLLKKGYSLHTFSYEDLLESPLIHASRLTRVLGLSIEKRVLELVMRDISPEKMRLVQEKLKTGRNSLSVHHGLSHTGQNSRKIGNATNGLYLRILDQPVIDHCRRAGIFHLPQELSFKYGYM